MDIKGYILFGGGLLIVLVLLHGLYSAWRSRHARASSKHYRQPEQTNLELGGAAPPILMRSVESGVGSNIASGVGSGAEGGVEGSAGSGAESGMAGSVDSGLEDGTEDREHGQSWQPETASAQHEPQVGMAAPMPQETPARADYTEFQGERSRRVVIPGKRTEPTVPLNSRPIENGMAAQQREREPEPTDGLKDLVVIWVLARPGSTLRGRGLIEAFTANNLEYVGNVFSKLDPNTGAERYQVANGIEPGTFDLSNVDELSTPRIVLLLRFNPYNDPAEAFEDMLAVAQDVADSLNGELKDEHMSNMSIQTIEHCRQRIREYKRMSIRT